MVGHSLVGVAACYIEVFVVARETVGFEKQVEVHHIVNDDREIPRSEVPGTDCSDIAVETGAEIVCGVDYHGFDSVGRTEPEGISIAALNHEAQVVGLGVTAYRKQDIRIVFGIREEFFVAGQFVGIPERAREESAGPVVDVTGTQCSKQFRRALLAETVPEDGRVLVQLPSKEIQIVAHPD